MTDVADLVTICVVTSPTASDPSTETIQTTLNSCYGYGALSNCLLAIGYDGVRPEQRALTDAYREKLAALGIPDPLPAWGHQANTFRRALAQVQTPLLLFMEHDTPFTPDVQIDWEGCADTILSGELDLIRFLHESQIIPPHEHLMVANVQGKVPYIRTVQWSQRPHLARTDWYRGLIDTYFGPSSRCFIEDVMYGVVSYHWQTYGHAGLDKFRLGIYSDPEPTMQRSYHLDGRAGDPKGGQVFAYAGETPEGAPAPTLGRTFE